MLHDLTDTPLLKCEGVCQGILTENSWQHFPYPIILAHAFGSARPGNEWAMTAFLTTPSTRWGFLHKVTRSIGSLSGGFSTFVSIDKSRFGHVK